MTPTIQIAGVTGVEGFRATYGFVVTLSAAVLNDVTVNYRLVQDGSATLGVDTTRPEGTVTFTPGQTEQTILVEHSSSGTDESDENYTLELFEPFGGILAGGEATLQATGIILDTNGTENDLALFVSDPQISETDSGAKNAVFELRLSRPADSSITLSYTTADGTATAGSDYTATAGSVTFSAGQTIAQVSVPVLGDTLSETDETFSLVVTPQGAIRNGTADNAGIATIVDQDSDAALPIITIEGVEGIEAFRARYGFVVSLSEPVLTDVEVQYRVVQDGSATLGTDVSRETGTVIFTPGETQKTITIEHSSGGGDEADENYTVELFSPTGGTLAGSAPTLRATGIVLDAEGSANDLALFVSDPEIIEGDNGSRDAVFEIRLSRPAENDLTLAFATADGTARAGQDYTAQSGNVVFLAGQQVASVRVPVLGDTLVETDETFSLVVTPNGEIRNGTADSAGVATIRDIDGGGDLPLLSIEGVEGIEGFRERYGFVVTLSEPILQDVTVQYRVLQDGSAILGTDVSRETGSVTFNPGETQKLITIEHSSSSADESDENYTVELHSPERAALVGGQPTLKATGIVLDANGTSNDLALFVSDPKLVEGDSGTTLAVFELRLSRPAPQDITLEYATADGTATAGLDYTAVSGQITFAAGQQIASVDVPVRGDTQIEADETFSLVVTPNGLIRNATADSTGVALIKDEDGGGNLPIMSIEGIEGQEGFRERFAFVVTLSEAAESDISVDYRVVQDGSASLGTDVSRDTGTLTFAPGETQKTITVEHSATSGDEADENYALELASVTGAVLAGGEPTLKATGVVLDANGDSNNLALFVSDPVVVEDDSGSKLATFEITLSRPALQEITLDYTTVDGSALAGEDYTAVSGQITFAAGQRITSVAVEIQGDTDVEADEAFSLVVTPNGLVRNATADSTGIALIKDDDTITDLPILSLEGVSGVEAFRQTYGFVVTLSEPSLDEVRVSYQSEETGSATGDLDFPLEQGEVVFAPGETRKYIFIEHSASSGDESDESYGLTLSSPVNAVLAGDEKQLRREGIIQDQNGEANNIALLVSDPIVGEKNGAQFAVFDVRLSVPSLQDITLSYATADGTATAGSDYVAQTGTLTFLAGQTLTSVAVALSPDRLDEFNETFSLVVTPNGLTRNGTEDSTGIATILDNAQTGGPEADILGGTLYDDVILGGGGGDTMSAPSGRNVFVGGDGPDTITGGTGTDTIDAGAGDDRAFGGAGADLIIGGAGHDVAAGGTGSDTISGDAGNDRLYGDALSLADIPDVANQVYRIYLATLGRVPDVQGQLVWVSQLSEGTSSFKQVVQGFVGSREFVQTYGALDNAGFVNLLYRNVLGRDADDTGLAGWVSRLEAGTSRADVVIGFAQSPEFQIQTRQEASTFALTRTESTWTDDMFRLYQATLGRTPDKGGLLGWTETLGGGRDYLSVAQGFTNSVEFQRTYGTLDDSAFVNLLYRNVLGRDGDPAGLEGWLDDLDNGLSRAEVVAGFAQSQEFIKDTTPAIKAWVRAQGDGDRIDGGEGDDVLAGGQFADTFVFNATQNGSNQILNFEIWDHLQFDGFGFASAADVRAAFSVTDGQAIFDDQGVSVQLRGIALDSLTDDQLLF